MKLVPVASASFSYSLILIYMCVSNIFRPLLSFTYQLRVKLRFCFKDLKDIFISSWSNPAVLHKNILSCSISVSLSYLQKKVDKDSEIISQNNIAVVVC